jgi:putative DNA primase/helicase
VEEVQAYTQAPVPLVASSALAAVSLAIQAQVDVSRDVHLESAVSLFLLTIADSGERKSTCDCYFTSAIRQYQEQQAEAMQPALLQYEADLSAWTAMREGLLTKIKSEAKGKGEPSPESKHKLSKLQREKPERPRVPHLFYADTTPEALGWGLARTWPSAGVLSAEAGTVLGSHGMGKDSIMRNLALLNQLWERATVTVDRRSVESFQVKGARLTVHLQTQEATLRDFLERAGKLARGTGFLARFLLAWPTSTQGQRLYREAPQSWPCLAEFNRRIAAILASSVPLSEDGALTPAMLSLDRKAKAAFVEYYDAIERELSSGGELYDVRDVASKSADNAARLAALFQVFQHGIGAVGVDPFQRGSRIAAWHLSESRRFFNELALPAEALDVVRLDSWIIKECRERQTHILSTRETQNRGPVRKRDLLDAALRELEQLDRVKLIQESKRRLVKVNPGLLRQA